MISPSESPQDHYDVIVIGGALSGAATAWMLKRRNPKLRILVLERTLKLKRRVGESTVEISSYFLGRVLDLNDHLQESHLTKQGLRFWLRNDQVESLDQSSEIGPGYNVRLPGYQVDRSVLDEEVLARAAACGVEVRRGILATEITLTDGGMQMIDWRDEASGAEGRLQSRWVVDASGVKAMLARKHGWFVPNTEHPTATAWSRWRGVKNWDSRDLAEKFPDWAAAAKGWRFNATNHLVGFGWWAWMIPLKGGDVSVGVVFDQRIVELPPGESIGARLHAMLCSHPVGREMLSDATWQESDVHFRRDLAYKVTQHAGNGFVLVGDAAGFMDPFYSPGMDWISYTTCAAVALIDGSLRGRSKAERIARHNDFFRTSYDRWFRAIYRDKYFYMGDFELMTLAFRLDLGLYYFGVVSQPFKYGHVALETPAFAGESTYLPSRLIAFYNRRLATMARSRLERGTWGRKNHRHRFSFRSYELTWRLPFRLLGIFAMYVALEMREGWRTWFRVPDFTPLPRHDLPAKPVVRTTA